MNITHWNAETDGTDVVFTLHSVGPLHALASHEFTMPSYVAFSIVKSLMVAATTAAEQAADLRSEQHDDLMVRAEEAYKSLYNADGTYSTEGLSEVERNLTAIFDMLGVEPPSVTA